MTADEAVRRCEKMIRILARDALAGVHAAVKRQLGNDDLRSVGYVAVIVNLPRFDPARGSVQAFMRPIVFDKMRREVQRVYRIVVNDTFREKPPATSSVAELFADLDGKYIRDLSHTERHVLRRRYLDGAEFREISEEVGRSVRTTHDIHGRALRKIKRSLERD